MAELFGLSPLQHDGVSLLSGPHRLTGLSRSRFWERVLRPARRRGGPALSVPGEGLVDADSVHPARDQSAVDGQIVAGHPTRTEPLVEHLSDRPPAQLGGLLNSANRVVEIINHKTCDPVINHFRDRPAAVSNHRRAARHRLDHDQPERFRPVDREQQRPSVPQKLVLLALADLTDIFHQRILEERLDCASEVIPINGIHFRRDTQLHPDPAGDLNGTIHALLRRNSTEERKIIARPRPELVQVRRQSVINRGLPVRTWQRSPLGVGDGDNRDIPELVVQSRQLGDIKPAVQRRDVGDRLPSGQRVVKVIDVEVDDVEPVRLPEHFLKHDVVQRQPVHARLIEAQCLRADRDQLRLGDRVAAGEQCDLVPLTDQFLGQIGDNPLRSTIQLRWNGFVERRDLRDPHNILLRTRRRTHTSPRRDVFMSDQTRGREPDRPGRERRMSDEPTRGVAPTGQNPTSADDRYYVTAPAPPGSERDRVLKHGDTFAVLDYHGDIRPAGMKEQGLYHEGTRFLSALVLRLGRGKPLFLSSTVNEDNVLLSVDLTNPDIRDGDRITVPRGTVHLFRGVLLWQGICHQRLRMRNYSTDQVEVVFSLHFEADFADIFEVRGTTRTRRGHSLPPTIKANSVVLSYEGLDGVIRRTRLEFDPPPERLSGSDAQLRVVLPPQGEATFQLAVICEIDEPSNAPPGAPQKDASPDGDQTRALGYDSALVRSAQLVRTYRSRACHVYTDNELFNDWFNRSSADLGMMITHTPQGLYPYAGVPWFSTPFGRDGIITALEVLWANPDVARGVLRYLATTQATAEIPEQDAEPGKILHETRRGEMAALGEIPFGRYYGSVDSTPLFVLLAGAYYERTGDRDLIERIWPNLELALRWIEVHGDADGDGFVEYARQSPKGLVQQGWKDSHDSVFHADGTPAAPPIALCEVQAYVYGAWRAAAKLASELGHAERSRELSERAQRLQEKFEEAFWCEDLSTYALALDGDKRPCRVRTSNAGQCLFTGIARPDRARRVAQTLISPGFFSGWGIRTVASTEARYNPMSYHNGSIWPHDNAMIAVGFAHYGLYDAANKVLAGLFDASLFVDLQRMPELFCGFPRRAGEGPTLYPVACAPQAWAAASVFQLLRATLGLTVTADPARVFFRHPRLPEFLGEIWIRDLTVGPGSVDCRIVRHQESVSVEVLRRSGDIEVMVLK